MKVIREILNTLSELTRINYIRKDITPEERAKQQLDDINQAETEIEEWIVDFIKSKKSKDIKCPQTVKCDSKDEYYVCHHWFNREENRLLNRLIQEIKLK